MHASSRLLNLVIRSALKVLGLAALCVGLAAARHHSGSATTWHITNKTPGRGATALPSPAGLHDTHSLDMK